MDGVKQAIYDGLDWLVGQAVGFIDLLFNALVELVNLLLQALSLIIMAVVSLLPVDSSCELPLLPPIPVAEVLNFINWIIPVQFMGCVLGAIVANYIVYFTVGRVLKLLQVA